MIETRHNEVKFTTSDIKKMIGMYSATQIVKTWEDEAKDSDTGETIKFKRNELLLDSGIRINNDLAESIRFWIEEGSISEVTVTNQRRMAEAREHYGMQTYKAVAKIGIKRHSFLLYAHSVPCALEILTDYIELNYSGCFYITDIKELDYCVILVDRLDTVTKNTANLNIDYRKNDEDVLSEPVEEEEEEDDYDSDEDLGSLLPDGNIDASESLKLKFYQILARINSKDPEGEEEEITKLFIVRTFTATRANMIINKYLADKDEERVRKSENAKPMQIVASIEECKILSVGSFIPYEFSEAYKKANDELPETDDTGATPE